MCVYRRSCLGVQNLPSIRVSALVAQLCILVHTCTTPVSPQAHWLEGCVHSSSMQTHWHAAHVLLASITCTVVPVCGLHTCCCANIQRALSLGQHLDRLAGCTGSSSCLPGAEIELVWQTHRWVDTCEGQHASHCTRCVTTHPTHALPYFTAPHLACTHPPHITPAQKVCTHALPICTNETCITAGNTPPKQAGSADIAAAAKPQPPNHTRPPRSTPHKTAACF